MASSFNSAPLGIQYLDNVSLEMAWTGTPTGTIVIQGSNSQINWQPLTLNPAITQPAGSASFYSVDLNQVGYAYIQVAYTAGSGSGNLTVWAAGKAV
jgi:hypothetical protein